MRDATGHHDDQTRWNAFLVQSISDAEILTLQTRLDAVLIPSDPSNAPPSASPPAPSSTQGRLLALYIARTQQQRSAACDTTRQAARAALETLSAQLRDRDTPPVPAASSGAPTSAPSDSPVENPISEPVSPGLNPLDPKDPKLEEAIRRTYQMMMNRTPSEEEVQVWLGNFQDGMGFHDCLLAAYEGPEAAARRAAQQVIPDATDGDFIVDLYRVIRGRGCAAQEVDMQRRRLEAQTVTRQGLLNEAFAEVAARERANAPAALHDGLSASIMGTGRVVTVQDWQDKARDVPALTRARAALKPARPFVWAAEPGIRVSAIASLYCGGDYVEQFMDNITGQTGFDRYCELIIVDADSPENEAETINRYLDKHPHVVYQRMNSRIGIYEAWNVGVEMARGRYLTNTNLDDLRREDSLEIQAGALDEMGFADVVYQDFYTTFDPTLSWAEVAAFGYKSDLPMLTPHNMLFFNSPHNAPMWRKTLHDDLGLFDASYKSAGDYEFWMRCLAAGKKFYKVNEPHVIYYQNPQGLSTRADSRGLVEAHAITRKYGPSLMPRAMTCDYDALRRDLGDPDARDDRDRYFTAQAGLRGLARRFKGGAA